MFSDINYFNKISNMIFNLQTYAKLTKINIFFYYAIFFMQEIVLKNQVFINSLYKAFLNSFSALANCRIVDILD